MENPQELLQKLQQTGLLPMLIQKFQQSRGQQTQPGQLGGQPPRQAQAQAPPATPPPNTGTAGQPGVGGAVPGGGGQPPVKYDPSGAGASMPPPVAQPHEAVQGIASLLMNYHKRKKGGEEAEAANIANNLIQAMRNNDKETINDIMNNDHSKKILNKVYKGWLTKSQEAQKPGKEQDPTVSGFEAGIQKATSGQQQQPQKPPQGQPPGSVGGYRMPQPTQEAQLGSAKTSAEVQASQQDPSRLLSGGATAKTEASLAESHAKIEEAASKVKVAQASAQKAEAELKIKEEEGKISKTKGEISLETERTKLLESHTRLDITRENLKRAIILKDAANKPKLKQSDKLKLEAATRAKSIVDGIVTAKRDLNEGDIQSLQNELKTAGATKLADGIRAAGLAGWFAGKKGTSSSAAMLQNSLKLYIDTLEANQGVVTPPPPKKEAKTVSDDDPDDDPDDTGEGDAEPQEGDEVEHNGALYKYDGTQYVKQDKKPK